MRSRLARLGPVAVIGVLLGVVVSGLFAGNTRDVDRAYELQQQLRCPVCTSVSIAESMSETALSMRAIVDEQVAAGRSDEQIIDYFQTRYGQWVLVDPPVQGNTLPLWLLPLGAAGVGVATLAARGRRSPPGSGALPEEDRERVAAAVAALRSAGDPDDQP